MTQSGVLKRPKAFVKKLLGAARRSYVGSFHTFGTPELKASLRQLGVSPGQAILVHSSFGAFEGFSGKPSDIVTVLEELVGPEGTVLMPSLPFTKTAVDYVKSGKVTDIARTPSRNGLLTEVFRRQKGTLRSVHPTHPVLARGARAAAMLADHRYASTPCGDGSPFSKLLEEKGKILFIGVSVEAMTFFHYLEELFEDKLNPSPFEAEIFEVPVKNGTETVTVKTRLFDTNLSRRRTIMSLMPELQRLDGCRSGKIGVVDLLLVDATATRNAFDRCLQNGVSFYE